MGERNDIALVRALGFIAWADHRISAEERDMLKTVMDALEIPAERRRELCESLRAPPATAEEIAAAFDDDTERRFALAQAILMAGADGPVTAVEQESIAALARAMGVDAAELAFIYQAVDATNEAFSGSFADERGSSPGS